MGRKNLAILTVVSATVGLFSLNSSGTVVLAQQVYELALRLGQAVEGAQRLGALGGAALEVRDVHHCHRVPKRALALVKNQMLCVSFDCTPRGPTSWRLAVQTIYEPVIGDVESDRSVVVS